MTVKSGFFSDGSSYNQADFNAFLLDSIGSGYVLGYENELLVSHNSPANMGVFVRTGRCYVQGYYGWVTANEALTVPTADATKPRIDRVVARLSVSVNQSVIFAVKTGTPAANPSAPALTRTSETYEISLARIAVGAGVTSITSANITDERGDATVCGVAGVKHSWQYLSNVAIDVSGMSVNAGVSDRDPVYFNGTKWVVATKGAVGFYDKANDAVITAGYLGGFTGLTPGAIVGYRGIAITATEIVVLETPVDTDGYKQIGGAHGDLTGNVTGDISGYLIRAGYLKSVIGATGVLVHTFAAQTYNLPDNSGTHEFIIDTDSMRAETAIVNDLYRLFPDPFHASTAITIGLSSYVLASTNYVSVSDVYTSYDIDNNVIDTKTIGIDSSSIGNTWTGTGTLNISKAVKVVCNYTRGGAVNARSISLDGFSVYAFKIGAV